MSEIIETFTKEVNYRPDYARAVELKSFEELTRLHINAEVAYREILTNSLIVAKIVSVSSMSVLISDGATYESITSGHFKYPNFIYEIVNY
jgi:ketol-acid reductoisomerase